MCIATKTKALINWGLSAFDKVQALAFKLPFVRVDRTAFITKTLSKTCTADEVRQAIAASPLSVLGKEAVHKTAKRCIWRHALFTSLLSALAVTPPNDYAQWVLLPLDLIQLQLVIYIVAQKLMYLYGYQIKDENDAISSRATIIIATVSAIMIGTHRLSQTMKSAVGATARRTVLHISARAGNRLVAIKFIQQLMKWFGIEVTKNTLTISLQFFISTLCASISGLVSFWLIYPMCNRLLKHLEEGEKCD